MNKLLSVLVAAMFAAVSVNALAAKHLAAEKGAKMEKTDKKTAGKKTMTKGEGKKTEGKKKMKKGEDKKK